MNRIVLLLLLALAPLLSAKSSLQESPSRLSDERKEIDPDEVPDRPAPLIEIGDKFLATGEVSDGFRIPTGAIWQPRFMLFGDLRRSYGYWEDRGETYAEGVIDMPLFANLYLSSTERILLSINPFSRDGRYTKHTFQPRDESIESFNAEIDSLFFEGDFPELFPEIGASRGGLFDFGFSVGRQLIGPEFSDGLLINDRLDAFGLVRKSAPTGMFSHYRIAAIAAWADVHRGGDRSIDNDAMLFALLTTADMSIRSGGVNFSTSLDFDIAYVSAPEDSGDGVYATLGASQRLKTGLGAINTTFRVAGSKALENETDAVRDGALLTFESSLTPHGSKNLVYLNGYFGVDQFSSAARDPRFSGALTQVGLAFADLGLGAFPTALSSNPADSAGIALGWQIYSSDKRRQVVFEGALQAPNDEFNEGAAAMSARFQQAFFENIIWRLDGIWSTEHGEEDNWALRTEATLRF